MLFSFMFEDRKDFSKDYSGSSYQGDEKVQFLRKISIKKEKKKEKINKQETGVAFLILLRGRSSLKG